MNAREEIELILYLLDSLINRTHNMGADLDFKCSHWLSVKLSDVENDMKMIKDFYDEHSKK